MWTTNVPLNSKPPFSRCPNHPMEAALIFAHRLWVPKTPSCPIHIETHTRPHLWRSLDTSCWQGFCCQPPHPTSVQGFHACANVHNVLLEPSSHPKQASKHTQGFATQRKANAARSHAHAQGSMPRMLSMAGAPYARAHHSVALKHTQPVTVESPPPAGLAVTAAAQAKQQGAPWREVLRGAASPAVWAAARRCRPAVQAAAAACRP